MSDRRKPVKPPETTVISDEGAVLALASPLRVEIVQAFSTGGRLTVAELAEAVGKTRGALYYHVRKLVEAGVLVEAERHLVGRRYEASYEIVAERLAVGVDPSTESGRAAATKLMRATLRQAGREFEAALGSGVLAEEAGAPIGHRQRAWLTEKDLGRIRSHLARVEEICTKATVRAQGNLYSVTNLVVPIPAKDS